MRRPTSLRERIATASSELAPVERKVMDFVSQNPDDVAFLSTTQLASRLGVSTTTIVRSAQALGYAGVSEMREELRDSLQRRARPDEQLRRRLDELEAADGGTLFSHVLSNQIRLIEEAIHSVPLEDFTKAVRILSQGERILIHCLGPSSGFAHYFAQWLKRLGHPAAAITSQGRGLADDLVTLGRGDVLVVLAFSYVVPELEVALERARSCGAKSILITDALAHALRGQYSVALSVSRGDAGLFPFSTAVVAILESLVLGIAGQDRRRSAAALKDLNEMRTRFDAPELRHPGVTTGKT